MSIPQFSLRNRSVIWFVLIIWLCGGIWSFAEMGKREDSTFVLKSAVITCSYPGANPAEVEHLVTEPLSRSIQSMRNIKKISSESYYGMSRIMVELQSGTPAEDVPQLWDELRRKVVNASVELPVGAGPVSVNDDYSDVYGLYYALVADDSFSWREMRKWSQELKTDLLTIKGVQKVALYGEQTPVVNIFFTQSALSNFSITPETIIRTMKQQNAVVNSGEIVSGELTLKIVELGSYMTVEDIENQLLIASDGKQFRLGDLADVEMDYMWPPTTLMKVDNHRAIGVGVSTDSREDVVKIGQRVTEHIKMFAEDLPAGVEIVSLYPEDEIAEQANYDFLLNLLASVAIVIVIIVVAMGIRGGVIIGASLLFTIGGTLFIMYLLGEGINRTSLAGFIIAMGMLVDNAIVVVDNTLKLAACGVTIRDGIIESAETPKWSLLGATFIAILSFLPLYTAPSSVAEIIKPLFVVITISLLLSWLLALTQVPLWGDMFLKRRRYVGEGGVVWFKHFVRFALHHRGIVIIVVVLLFAVSLYLMRTMPQNFFPQLDKNYFRADVILPEAFDIGATQQNLDKMTDWLNRQKEVTRVSTTAGASPLRYYLASGSYAPRPNFGNILVEVSDSRYSSSLKRKFDEFVADSCPDVWLRSSLFKLSPVPEATIEIGFVGPNIDTLLYLTHQVEKIMWDNPQTTNIRNSWGNRIPMWMPIYSQVKGQRIGVSRSDMAQWLNLATQGYPMAEMRQGDEIIPILLKDRRADNFDMSNLYTMPIFTSKGRVFTVEQASDGFDFDYRIGAIKRINRQRVMKAQCDPIDGVNATQLFEELRRRVESEIHLPRGYSMEYYGQQESQQESNAALLSQIPFALILIFIILLLMFGNYRDPIAILLMTPLIFIGVIGGLLLLGKSFDFFTLLGVIGLVGMNIKNAVILISSINDMRRSGIDPATAVIRAASERLLPVCMASFTTILALIPLLGDSLFGGMAAAIMGGLFVATVLTVIVLPISYSLMYNIKLQDV